jgi:hypothetical protein
MGADNGNVSITPNNSSFEDRVPGFNNINLGDIGRCISGQYPTLSSALNLMKKPGNRGVPLSRAFSVEYVENTLFLYYKAQIAGVVEVIGDKAAVSLLPDYNHSTYFKALDNLGIGINA